MKENSDKDAYAADTHIDELLNSFIDGELTAGQQAEVQRLIGGNAKIAQRLRQLQKCKRLVGLLPRAEAPPTVLEGVRASLAGATLPAERSTSEGWTEKKHLLVRRVLSAAAMIGLVAVLATVIHTMVAPQGPLERPLAVENERPLEEIKGTARGSGAVAAMGFSGRLELKTSDLVAVSAFVNRAIEDINLSDSVSPGRREDKRIYSLSCSRQDLNALLADLEEIWPKLDSATLAVNTEVFGEQAVVSDVTTKQMAQIVAQNDPERRIEVVRGFAALNDMAARLPGRAIASAIEGGNKDRIPPWRVPKPFFAEREKPSGKPPSQAEDEETVRLTIVVSW